MKKIFKARKSEDLIAFQDIDIANRLEIFIRIYRPYKVNLSHQEFLEVKSDGYQKNYFIKTDKINKFSAEILLKPLIEKILKK